MSRFTSVNVKTFPLFFRRKTGYPPLFFPSKKERISTRNPSFFILPHDFSMKKDTPPDVSFQGRTFGRRRLSCISSDPGRVCGRGEFYHLKDSSLRYNYNTFLLFPQYILNFLYKKERSCGAANRPAASFVLQAHRSAYIAQPVPIGS